MFDYYLSFLSDPEDEPLFREAYRRYQDTARAAALQALNQQCDVRDIVDSIWTEVASQFHKTKKYLLITERDAYRGWIGGISTLIAIQENAKTLAENEGEVDDLELAGDEEAEESE